MKMHWMTALVAAMLSPAAMATVTVTVEGFFTSGSQTIDCPVGNTYCEGFTTNLRFDAPIAITQTFSFEYGASPGRLPVSTLTTTARDGSGRSYDVISTSQRYANFATGKLSDAQLPASPVVPFDPVAGTGDSVAEVFTVAQRTRSVNAWSDTQEIFRAFERFQLISALNWTASDGAWSSTQFSVNPSSLGSFAGTFENVDDLESNAYFLDLMGRTGGCNDCLRLSLSNGYGRADGTHGNTGLSGFGRIVSITESASAVPEPLSYALMLAGVAAIGVAARRRRGALAVTP